MLNSRLEILPNPSSQSGFFTEFSLQKGQCQLRRDPVCPDLVVSKYLLSYQVVAIFHYAKTAKSYKIAKSLWVLCS